MTGPHQETDWSGGFGSGDEPRWAEPGLHDFPVAQPAPPPPPPEPVRRLPRAIAVTGSVGGAGGTVTAILLAALITEQFQRKVLLLDATPAGGDLQGRVFGATRAPGQPWETWAQNGGHPEVMSQFLRGRQSGLAIPPSDRLIGAADTARLVATTIESLTPHGWIVVLDTGSGALGSPALAAAVAAEAAVVLTIPQRADGANRTRLFLSGLAQQYDRRVVADAVIAVTDQDGAQPHVYQTLEGGLGSKVSDIVRIPMDPQLATGLAVAPTTITAVTRSAYTALIKALTGTQAAARRPAA
ncbi:MAG: hypothetical protein HOQ24_13790 [Mycobacteriaceae bacterium]|nr:hypothetical protein [Mycobacteriaceae bacterium]